MQEAITQGLPQMWQTLQRGEVRNATDRNIWVVLKVKPKSIWKDLTYVDSKMGFWPWWLEMLHNVCHHNLSHDVMHALIGWKAWSISGWTHSRAQHFDVSKLPTSEVCFAQKLGFSSIKLNKVDASKTQSFNNLLRWIVSWLHDHSTPANLVSFHSTIVLPVSFLIMD